MDTKWFMKSGHWLILGLVGAAILAYQYSKHKEEWPQSRWVIGGIGVIIAFGLYLYTARK